MKDVIKIGLGISLALFLCAIIGFAAIVWVTPSEYDKCYYLCVGNYRDMVSRTSLTQAEYLRLIGDPIARENCARECAPLYRTGIPFVIEVLERVVHNLAP